ncbi:MAG: nickel-dependent hydrogenase large subunit [Thiothrix sp.]
MTRKLVGPFNRVEGDLEVQLEMDADRVREAWVKVPMYRGFEQIMQGKSPDDALVITPRICGICSVSQSVASAYALADMAGVSAPPNGQHCLNLLLACENLADHLTHFYLFFMPDFARDVYAGESWHAAAAERFTAIKGTATCDVLPARAAFMHLMGTLGGHWPHTLNLQPGGVSKGVDSREKVRLLTTVQQFRRFLETTLFGDALEVVAALDSIPALENWLASGNPAGGDFRHFLHIARALELDKLGRATDRFMSYGAYRQVGEEGSHLFAQGVWQPDTTSVQAIPFEQIHEDLHASWMSGGSEPLHPSQGVTLPDYNKPDAYSWNKAPRLAGQVVETGALARQMVDGHPLIRTLVAQSGGNVQNRVIARLLELALVVPQMEQWIRNIQPGEPFYQPVKLPADASGAGLVEAARGSLGHWVTVRNKYILNYQIVAPTSWNFSPRDRDGVPGALEQALVNAPIRAGESEPVSVQHIVRSFDPCMVCTAH